jgi:hypothetical protein
MERLGRDRLGQPLCLRIETGSDGPDRPRGTAQPQILAPSCREPADWQNESPLFVGDTVQAVENWSRLGVSKEPG